MGYFRRFLKKVRADRTGKCLLRRLYKRKQVEDAPLAPYVPAAETLVEVVAQLGRLDYFLKNCVKENLVESPLDCPGVHCARALVEGRKLEGAWFNRTAFYRAQKRRKAGDPPVQENEYKTPEVLELAPLPCLANLARAGAEQALTRASCPAPPASASKAAGRFQPRRTAKSKPSIVWSTIPPRRSWRGSSAA